MAFKKIYKLWKEKSTSEKWAIGITILGGAVFTVALFWYGVSVSFDWGYKLDPDLVAKAGDFIGGIVGSLWALGGVLLVYAALQSQRKDFKTNMHALNNQINQGAEQKMILEIQGFENTFFKMLQSLNSITDSFVIYSHKSLPEQINSELDANNVAVYKGRSSLSFIFQEISRYVHEAKEDNKAIASEREAYDQIRRGAFLNIRAYEHILIPFNSIVKELVEIVAFQAPEGKRELYVNIIKSHLDPFQFALLGIEIILFHDKNKREYLQTLSELNFFSRDKLSRLYTIPQGPSLLEEILRKA